MNNNGILVSVIMSVYNSEKYVEESVRSIMKQSYSNLEVLIADDCSTDNSYEILLKLANEDSRIKLIKNSSNLKLAKTLNKLISLCKGKYIARMDSDDISHPDRIKEQLKFLENNLDIDFCGTNAIIINENGKERGTTKIPTGATDCKNYFRYGNVFIHPSVMLRADILQKNLYSENFKYAQDYELWGRLLFKENKKGLNLNQNLLYYRVSTIQVTHSHREEQAKLAASVLNIYKIEEIEDLEKHKSIFFFNDKSQLSLKIIKQNFVYLQKHKIPYTSEIYKKIMKLIIKRLNILWILYGILHISLYF